MDISTKLINIADNTPAVCDVVNSKKNSTSGSAVALYDVSPVEHNLGVKFKSKNEADIYGFSARSIDNPASSRSLTNPYGTTISTTDPSNSIEVTQTQWGDELDPKSYLNGYFNIGFYNNYITGEYVQFSFDLEIKENPLNATEIRLLSNGSSPTTFTFTEGRNVVKVYWNNTYDRQYLEFRNAGCSLVISNIQVERGEPTPYTPFISDFKDATLMTYGKNVFDFDPTDTGGNATVLEQTENGVIVQGIVGAMPGIQNYSNGWYGFTMNEKVVRGVPYVVSCDFTFIEDPYRPDNLNTVANRLQIQTEAVGGGTSNPSGSGLQAFRPEVGVKQRLYRTFVPDCDVVRIFVPTCSGTIKVENFMLAVGTTEGAATEYEPYNTNSAEYTPNEDGTVEGVTSISPNMTLIPNTNAVTVECSYFPESATDTLQKLSDMNKAFDAAKALFI